MEPENTKLNYKLIMNINSWTEINLNKIAAELSMPKTTIARALLNKAIREVLYCGIHNLTISFESIEVAKKKKDS